MTSKAKTRRVRAGAVCREGDSVLMVKLRDPSTGVERFFPPGGAIEPWETPLEAAIRETLEETGYRIAPVEKNPMAIEARYDYTWDGKTYDCFSTLFACRLDEPMRPPTKVDDASYHRGVFWIEISRLEEVLSFQKEIREAVLKGLRIT